MNGKEVRVQIRNLDSMNHEPNEKHRSDSITAYKRALYPNLVHMPTAFEATTTKFPALNQLCYINLLLHYRYM